MQCKPTPIQNQTKDIRSQSTNWMTNRMVTVNPKKQRLIRELLSCWSRFDSIRMRYKRTAVIDIKVMQMKPPNM